jgi:hypothetical protein
VKYQYKAQITTAETRYLNRFYKVIWNKKGAGFACLEKELFGHEGNRTLGAKKRKMKSEGAIGRVAISGILHLTNQKDSLNPLSILYNPDKVALSRSLETAAEAIPFKFFI